MYIFGGFRRHVSSQTRRVLTRNVWPICTCVVEGSIYINCTLSALGPPIIGTVILYDRLISSSIYSIDKTYWVL